MSLRSDSEDQYDEYAERNPDSFPKENRNRTVDRWVTYDSLRAIEKIHLGRYSSAEIKNRVVALRRDLRDLDGLLAADLRRRAKEREK